MASRTTWDDRAHNCLLLAIVKEAPPTSEQWERIIAVVQSQGYTYTADAALYEVPTILLSATFHSPFACFNLIPSAQVTQCHLPPVPFSAGMGRLTVTCSLPCLKRFAHLQTKCEPSLSVPMPWDIVIRQKQPRIANTFHTLTRAMA